MKWRTKLSAYTPQTIPHSPDLRKYLTTINHTSDEQQSVLGVYLKRTCSRVTSASSGVNNGSMGHGSVGQIDCREIMPKLRSTYDGRLVYKISYEERKDFLGYDFLAKS